MLALFMVNGGQQTNVSIINSECCFVTIKTPKGGMMLVISRL
jgi:hypothetical protein